MQSEASGDRSAANEQAYEGLVVAIVASVGVLSPLIAVCDDPDVQAEIIQRYETELQNEIRPYRLELSPTEPSLRKAIADLVAQEEYLQAGGRAVLTVVGTERISFLKPQGADRSPQDIFLGYLQWTREGLLAFPYPILLWVSTQLVKRISREAPDFWSWRKDVFRFASHPTTIVQNRELAAFRPVWEEMGLPPFKEEESIPLADLQELIKQTEARAKGPNDPLLATLYSQMGRIYAKRAERGEAEDYSQEIERAIAYFDKAAEIQDALGEKLDWANSLAWLGDLYRSQGNYERAEPLLQQALHLRQDLLGGRHSVVASSLNNLALLYYSQGRYEEAEPLYQQALHPYQDLLGDRHPDVAQSLNNLAALYYSQGRYEEAEPLYQQALHLSLDLLGGRHPAVASSLNNLAGLYKAQRRYEEAEPLYQQALHLYQDLLSDRHPDVAQSLNNLAALYKAQRRYEEAEPLYVEAVAIAVNTLGETHPNTITIWQNYVDLLQQAIDQGRTAELSDHPMTQDLLRSLQNPAE
jgi:tetratricopeptide (TPR) repeat protein